MKNSYNENYKILIKEIIKWASLVCATTGYPWTCMHAWDNPWRLWVEHGRYQGTGHLVTDLYCWSCQRNEIMKAIYTPAAPYRILELHFCTEGFHVELAQGGSVLEKLQWKIYIPWYTKMLHHISLWPLNIEDC